MSMCNLQLNQFADGFNPYVEQIFQTVAFEETVPLETV